MIDAPSSAALLASRLPGPATLRAWSVSMAALDAVLCPEREYRLYSYDAAYADGEAMASMDNGAGDTYAILFTPAGVLVRGFDHEAPLSPFTQDPPAPFPGLLESVPARLADTLGAAPYVLDGVPLVTVLLWRLTDAPGWTVAPVEYPRTWDEQHLDVDGARWLFSGLDGDPDTYVDHARDYFERAVDRALVEHFFSHSVATAEIVRALGADPAAVLPELHAMGYPVA
jgi:hypothetical protein